MNEWWGYVVRIAGTDEQKQIAAESGIGTTVISRWFKGRNDPSAKFVVAFARAHGRAPVEALVAAGYLTEQEAAAVIEVHRGPGELSDDDLLAEVRIRVEAGHLANESNRNSAGELKRRLTKPGMRVEHPEEREKG